MRREIERLIVAACMSWNVKQERLWDALCNLVYIRKDVSDTVGIRVW